MLKKNIDWLESHQQHCFYKKYFGIECPGCGMQSAFIELLKGNIIESIKLYPALLPIIAMLSFLILHIFCRFKKGAFILKILFIFTIFVIVVNYVLKITNFKFY